MVNTHDRVRVRDAADSLVSRQAVWYFPSDYAGPWRRLVAELVDLVVMTAVLLIAALAVTVALPPERSDAHLLATLLVSWLTCLVGYFVVLKRTRVGTVGYWMARIRIVDPQGRRPGLVPLLLRLGFVVLGPLNIVLDALWIPSDRCRQTLRDKLAHTYVVKAGAAPAGPGRIVRRTYSVMGATFVVEEVVPLSVGRGDR